MEYKTGMLYFKWSDAIEPQTLQIGYVPVPFF